MIVFSLSEKIFSFHRSVVRWTVNVKDVAGVIYERGGRYCTEIIGGGRLYDGRQRS